MNVERLHAIAKAISADITTTASVATMRELRDALRDQVNQPQDAGHQQRVAEALQKIEASLSASAIRLFAPSWLQVIEELGIESRLGPDLLRAVQETFARNQITPSIAADVIQGMAEDVEQLDEGLRHLLTGLSYFAVGAEDLNQGEAEVGMSIPRLEVDNELGKLGAEMGVLARILAPFLELGTGTRPPVIVSTVASSDFSVYVEMAPQAAALVALAVERVLNAYKNVLDIRRLRQELSDQGITDDALAGIDGSANARMSEKIEDALDVLVTRGAGVDAGRMNELRIELRMSLNQLANRIDRGYNIDVRAGVPPDGPAGAGDAETEALRMIVDVSPSLRFINRTGRPILTLAEVPPDDPPQGMD